MKKSIQLLVVATLLLAVTPVFACGKEGMGMGMMKMDGGHGMMMGKPSIVASNDGGVIVLMGNKLYKYDKNLNLVKEVELNMDEGIKKMCPMCQKMMDKKNRMDSSSEDKKKEDATPVEAGSEHQEHH